MKKVLLAAMTAVFVLAVMGCKNVAEESGGGATPSPTPATISYLTFKSGKTFDLGLVSSFGLRETFGPGWDGTLEYSTDKTTWTVWAKSDPTAKTAVESGGTYYIYLRGKNTSFVNKNLSPNMITNFTLSGSNVECSGNIMSLLDYNDPDSVAMGDNCFFKLFNECTLLKTAPNLPATTLTDWCYSYMFNGCTSLIKAPDLPATTLAEGCYANMFMDCDGALKSAGIMGKGNAVNAAFDSCCTFMYAGCNLLEVSKISGTPFVKFSDVSGNDAVEEMFSYTIGWTSGENPTTNVQYYYK